MPDQPPVTDPTSGANPPPERTEDGLESKPTEPPSPTDASPVESDGSSTVTVDPDAFGHTVTAEMPPVSVQAGLFAVCLGLLAGVVALVFRYRQNSAKFLQKLALIVPFIAGASLAVFVFPGSTDQLGTAIHEGLQVGLRIAPAAVDAGLRCSNAEPDDTSCSVTGVPALPAYVAEGASLVLSEMRLARPGIRVSEAELQRGLARAKREKRWGLQYVPLTAKAYGSDETTEAVGELRLSTIVLFLVVAAFGTRA